MAKKTNLKAEKAKRNLEYARKYKKRRPAFRGRPSRPAPSAAPATGE